MQSRDSLLRWFGGRWLWGKEPKIAAITEQPLVLPELTECTRPSAKRKANLRERLFVLQRGRCIYCRRLMTWKGKKHKRATLDHLHPRNGRIKAKQQVSFYTVRLACSRCNNQRGNQSAIAFYWNPTVVNRREQNTRDLSEAEQRYLTLVEANAMTLAHILSTVMQNETPFFEIRAEVARRYHALTGEPEPSSETTILMPQMPDMSAVQRVSGSTEEGHTALPGPVSRMLSLVRTLSRKPERQCTA